MDWLQAYMQVKNEVEGDDTDGAIWEDVWGCLHYAVQSMLLKYPAQEHIIHTLELSKKQTIGYETVRQLFPAWRDRKSLNSWLEYYARFEFLSPDHTKDGDEDDISNFQNWLHTEMSVRQALLQQRIFRDLSSHLSAHMTLAITDSSR